MINIVTETIQSWTLIEDKYPWESKDINSFKIPNLSDYLPWILPHKNDNKEVFSLGYLSQAIQTYFPGKVKREFTYLESIKILEAILRKLLKGKVYDEKNNWDTLKVIWKRIVITFKEKERSAQLQLIPSKKDDSVLIKIW